MRSHSVASMNIEKGQWLRFLATNVCKLLILRWDKIVAKHYRYQASLFSMYVLYRGWLLATIEQIGAVLDRSYLQWVSPARVSPLTQFSPRTVRFSRHSRQNSRNILKISDMDRLLSVLDVFRGLAMGLGVSTGFLIARNSK